MKIIKVTKEYFETEDEKIYFFEPLEKEISVEDMQQIINASVKMKKEDENIISDYVGVRVSPINSCDRFFDKKNNDTAEDIGERRKIASIVTDSKGARVLFNIWKSDYIMRPWWGIRS